MHPFPTPGDCFTTSFELVPASASEGLLGSLLVRFSRASDSKVVNTPRNARAAPTCPSTSDALPMPYGQGCSTLRCLSHIHAHCAISPHFGCVCAIRNVPPSSPSHFILFYFIHLFYLHALGPLARTSVGEERQTYQTRTQFALEYSRNRQFLSTVPRKCERSVVVTASLNTLARAIRWTSHLDRLCVCVCAHLSVPRAPSSRALSRAWLRTKQCSVQQSPVLLHVPGACGNAFGSSFPSNGDGRRSSTVLPPCIGTAAACVW